MSIKTSNIYSYFVPNLKAIKVGYGDSSVQRMKSYAKQYHLEVAESSLRTWEIPVSGLAQTIEQECRKTLLDAGLEKLAIYANEQEAQELFDLGDVTYEDAVLLVAETVDETIENMRQRLGGESSKSSKNSRKKREEIRIKQEKVQAAFDKRTAECLKEIVVIWEKSFVPLKTLISSEDKYQREFNSYYHNRFFKNWPSRKGSCAELIYKWKLYPKVQDAIISAFWAMRDAKSDLVRLYDRFGSRNVSAAERQFFVHKQGHLKIFVNFIDKDGWDSNFAALEVRLVVQEITHWGGEDAMELIELDPKLAKLVTTAEKILPPELEVDS